MTFRFVASAAVAFATLGCASAPASVPLDGLIGFVDPHWCTPSREFDILQESLIRWEPSGESYAPVLETPVVPTAFRSRIGEPRLTIDGREYRVTLPLVGTWNGLSLRSLVLVGKIESEQGFELVFDETQAEVLATANRAGFQIPPSGSEYRDDLNAAMGMNVAVLRADGGRGALSCFPG
jgi:hypothetical protein